MSRSSSVPRFKPEKDIRAAAAPFLSQLLVLLPLLLLSCLAAAEASRKALPADVSVATSNTEDAEPQKVDAVHSVHVPQDNVGATALADDTAAVADAAGAAYAMEELHVGGVEANTESLGEAVGSGGNPKTETPPEEGVIGSTLKTPVEDAVSAGNPKTEALKKSSAKAESTGGRRELWWNWHPPPPPTPCRVCSIPNGLSHTHRSKKLEVGWDDGDEDEDYDMSFLFGNSSSSSSAPGRGEDQGEMLEAGSSTGGTSESGSAGRRKLLWKHEKHGKHPQDHARCCTDREVVHLANEVVVALYKMGYTTTALALYRSGALLKLQAPGSFLAPPNEAYTSASLSAKARQAFKRAARASSTVNEAMEIHTLEAYMTYNEFKREAKMETPLSYATVLPGTYVTGEMFDYSLPRGERSYLGFQVVYSKFHVLVNHPDIYANALVRVQGVTGVLEPPRKHPRPPPPAPSPEAAR